MPRVKCDNCELVDLGDGPPMWVCTRRCVKKDKLTKPSEGWWACQRQMMSSLDGRLLVLSEKIQKAIKWGNFKEIDTLQLEYDTTDTIRRHLKSSLLWDTTNGE